MPPIFHLSYVIPLKVVATSTCVMALGITVKNENGNIL